MGGAVALVLNGIVAVLLFTLGIVILAQYARHAADTFTGVMGVVALAFSVMTGLLVFR